MGLQKWGCFEAIGDGDGGCKYLVTDRSGRYIGARRRPNAELHNKGVDVDMVTRWEPRKQIARMTVEQMRAVKKKMLKQYGKYVAAETVAEARKLLGMDEPVGPSVAKTKTQELPAAPPPPKRKPRKSKATAPEE